LSDIDLLDAGILKRLEGYRLVRQRPVFGHPGGILRSLQKGGAVEFADYREYTPGDEPRRVDWRAYARLRRLYVKEFLDERQQTTLLLIDASASMDWSGANGHAHKGRYALQIAAGLGTCLLAGNDRLVIICAGGEETGKGAGWKISPEFKSRTALPGLWSFLKTVAFGGSAGMAAGLRNALKLLRGIKSLYVFSDLYDLSAEQEMFHLAAGHGMEATVFHILSPEEREPAGDGEYLLLDAETGARIEITLSPAAYLAYSRRLDIFQQEVDNCCRCWGVQRVSLDSGEAAADTLFKTLPRAGVLKPKG